MFNIFEQPWTMLVAAVISLLIILVIRAALPDKRRFWQFLIPAAVAAAGFGMYYFVETDAEQIASVIQQAGRAAQRGDCQAIEPLLAENYQDRYHRSKDAAMRSCKSRLSAAMIERVVVRITETEVQGAAGNTVFTARVVFEEGSQVYFGQMLFKLQAELSRSSGSWRITSVDLLEINNRPANWRDLL